MIRLPRWIVATAALSWLGYHIVLAAISISVYRDLEWILVATLLYVIAAVSSVVFYRGWGMPRLQALFNLAVTVALIVILSDQLVVARLNDYATWHISALGALLTVTAVRQHRWIAALGLISLALHVITWGGFGYIFNSGLIGAASIVLVGIAASRGIANAVQGTEQYLAEARENAKATEAQSAAHQQRMLLLRQTLNRVLPTLRLITTRRGQLSAAERAALVLIEASLRDEIRGRELLDDGVRQAVREARSRGVEVLLLDEGGLDELGENRRQELRAAVVEALRETREGRVTVRAKTGEGWNVTIAAVRMGARNPDLWLRV